MALPDFRIKADRHTSHEDTDDVSFVGDAHTFALDMERMLPSTSLKNYNTVVSDTRIKISAYVPGLHACTIYGEPAILFIGHIHPDSPSYGLITTYNDDDCIKYVMIKFGLDKKPEQQSRLSKIQEQFKSFKCTTGFGTPVAAKTERMVPLLLPHTNLQTYSVPYPIYQHVHTLNYLLSAAVSTLQNYHPRNEALIKEIQTKLGINHV